MANTMRQSTLEQLGLGTVLEMIKRGQSPVNVDDLVDKVFGNADNRGSLVISGANGIVGAGKMMQLGVRLQPFGVPLIGLDVAGAPDGIGMQVQGLVDTFGNKRAAEIMSNIISSIMMAFTCRHTSKRLDHDFSLKQSRKFLRLKNLTIRCSGRHSRK